MRARAIVAAAAIVCAGAAAGAPTATPVTSSVRPEVERRPPTPTPATSVRPESRGAERPEVEGRPTAHPRAYHSRAEKAEVRLGEPFGYQIEVIHGPEETYALPPSLELAPFRATPGGCRREQRGGDVVTTCTMRLALLDLGPHDVPDVALEAKGPDRAATLPVPGPRVTGVGVIDPAVPAEALQLRDLAPPAPLLVRSLRLVWWTLGVVAGLALAAVAVAAWRRRARAAEEPAPPLPPELRFARRLDALEEARLPERGLAREHVVRLSEAVREYLGAVSGTNALDLTTGELVERLRRAADPRLDLEAIGRFCETVDLVKFARADVTAKECADGVRFGRELIRTTTPATSVRPERSGAERPEVEGRPPNSTSPTPVRPERRGAERPEVEGRPPSSTSPPRSSPPPRGGEGAPLPKKGSAR